MNKRFSSVFVLYILWVLMLALTACTSPATTAAPTEAPAEPTVAPAEPTEAPAEPTEAPAEPTEVPAEPTEAPAEPILIRFGSIAGASQGYIPKLLMDNGIGEKYGFTVEVIPLTGTGQQWTGLRSGDFDVASGSVLDLLRQRQGGLEVHAIRGFSTFGNPIVALADSPYNTLADLAGARVGTPSTALLDWMIIRAAGVTGSDFDIEVDAEAVNASPPLITELLSQGEIDAALQFSDFTLAPINEGTLKAVTTVPQLMEEAGFDPQSFYLLYSVSDTWRAEHAEALPLLIAAMNEAVELMLTDDSVWPELAAFSGMENEALLPAFIEQQRRSFQTTFDEDKLAPTQDLLDSLVEVVGEEPVGVTTVDPEAFDFEAALAAESLDR